MKVRFYWNNYNYFSYEIRLAKKEIEKTFQVAVKDCHEYLESDIENMNWKNTASRLTYFSKICSDDECIIPRQTQLEMSSNGVSDLNRQITRYSTHGLHEYRGKFNPQIVRSIGNLLGLEQNRFVFDPFCGSGTTLLEAFHIGWNAIGLDRNPLAVQIANAKLALLKIPQDFIDEQYMMLRENLLDFVKAMDFSQSLCQQAVLGFIAEDWRNSFKDWNYLQGWFTENVLVQLRYIFDQIAKLSSIDLQLIMRVMVSDLVREVSLQEPSDLRIRRRKDFPTNYDVITPLIKKIDEKLRVASQTRKILGTNPKSHVSQIAYQGDIRMAQELLIDRQMSKFDAVITSPPYAMGLPYIDTDRLSLVLLELINSNEIHETQKSLIGNREITTGQRRKLIQRLTENQDNLPSYSAEFCLELQYALDENDGFRRQNKPSLLYNYFADMAEAFKQIHGLLKPDSPFALVVGNNKTTLGGKMFVIDTPSHLAIIAEANGYRIDEIITLDTYHRYDIHQSNSIDIEKLLILRTE